MDRDKIVQIIGKAMRIYPNGTEIEPANNRDNYVSGTRHFVYWNNVLRGRSIIDTIDKEIIPAFNNCLYIRISNELGEMLDIRTAIYNMDTNEWAPIVKVSLEGELEKIRKIIYTD